MSVFSLVLILVAIIAAVVMLFPVVFRLDFHLTESGFVAELFVFKKRLWNYTKEWKAKEDPEPAPEPEEEVCPQGGYTYEVKAGDTLARIAASFQSRVPGITWQQIARFNNLYAPYTLNIGQILRIPCVAGKG